MPSLVVIRRRRLNRQAGIIAAVAGALLLVSGANGASSWRMTGDVVDWLIGENPAMHVLFAILIVVASFGGLVVLLGALLYYKDEPEHADVLLDIGTGMGAIEIAISILFVYLEIDYLRIGGIGIGFAGVIASIIAKNKAEF